MKRMRFFYLAMMMLMVGCGLDRKGLKQKLITEATAEIPAIRGFHKMYPLAEIELFSDRFQKGTTKIQMKDIAFDRYLLTLTIGIEVDEKRAKIVSHQEPLITLLEITSVTGSADGPLKSEYGSQFSVSPSEWQNVIQSAEGELATKFGLKTNAPVAGISALKAYIHTPSIQ